VREFAKGSFTLGTAPRSLRLIYAAFLLLASLGFASQLGVQLGRIGITPTQIAAYYRGSESGEVLSSPSRSVNCWTCFTPMSS
jgi:hypothetical protein